MGGWIVGQRGLALALLIALGASVACATPRGATVPDRRASVREMREDTLTAFFAAEPSLRERLREARAYAVFSNRDLQVFFLGAGQGYGLAHDKVSGRDTFMRMAQLETGFGLGIADFRVLFLFFDDVSFGTFVEKGWRFGVSGEASAIAGGDTGATAGARGELTGGAVTAGGAGKVGRGYGATGVAASVGQGVEVYQLTENGLALRATLAGTRYWKDGELN